MADQDNSQKPEPKKKSDVKDTVVALIVLVVIILLIIGAVHLFSSHKHAKYETSVDIDNTTVINPATLSVAFHVKNVGDDTGTPYCTLMVGDDNYTYSGSDAFALKKLNPGQTVTSTDNLTITKQGAQYVTQGKLARK